MNRTASSTEGHDRSFVGRLEELKWLERSLTNSSVVVIHGVRGVGKTSIANRITWRLLDRMQISTSRAFWFSFEWDSFRAANVVNGLGIALIGVDFVLDPMEQRIERLAVVLRNDACVLIWDNIDTMPDEATARKPATISASDHRHIRQLKDALREGKSRILITSRSQESWLGTDDCVRFELRGLEQADRWKYVESEWSAQVPILDLANVQLAALLDLTHGHPIAMRIVLARLKYDSIGKVNADVRAAIDAIDDEPDDSQRSLLGILRYAVHSMPQSSRPFFAVLALHDRFVSRCDLEAILIQAENPLDVRDINAVFESLIDAGLVSHNGGDVYQIHALLTEYLRHYEITTSHDSLQRSFAAVMACRTTRYRERSGPEGRVPFALYDLNFRVALDVSHRLGMDMEFGNLLAWLNEHAWNRSQLRKQVESYQFDENPATCMGTRHLDAAAYYKQAMMAWQLRNNKDAEIAFARGLRIAEDSGTEDIQATLWHALGRLKREQQEVDPAKEFFDRALRIYRSKADEYKIADIARNQAWIARKQADLNAAKRWISQARSIYESRGDQFNAAKTYDELGILAYAQGDSHEAFRWLNESLKINQDIGNIAGQAITCEQIGYISIGLGELDKGLAHFRWALQARDAQGNDFDGALVYGLLGFHSQKSHDCAVAKRWLGKSVNIAEGHGNWYAAAFTYHILGTIMAARGEFMVAEAYYQRAIEIFERVNRDDASASYHQMGTLEQIRGNLDVSEHWYHKCLEIEERRADEYSSMRTYQNLGIVAQKRRDFETAEKWLRKSLEIKLARGDRVGAAKSYHQLGRVAEESKDLLAAERWYWKSVKINLVEGNQLGAANSYYHLGSVADLRGDTDNAHRLVRKALEIFERLKQEDATIMALETLRSLEKN